MSASKRGMGMTGGQLRAASAGIWVMLWWAGLHGLHGPPTAAAQVSSPAGPSLSAALQAGFGEGDFDFYLDVGAIRQAGEGRVVTRALVQVPVRAVLEATKENRAELRLTARAYAAKEALEALAAESGAVGDTVSSSTPSSGVPMPAGTQEFLAHFDAAEPVAMAERHGVIEVESVEALTPTDSRLLELALELPAGDYVLVATVENLSQFKRGLLDRLRKKPLASEARMLLHVPDLWATPTLADPVFRVGHGEHRDYPARLYGLLNDSLHVATTVFGNGELDVEAEVHDRNGKLSWSETRHVQVQTSADVSFHTDVNTFPAGQYWLTMRVRQDDEAIARQRGFDVAWSLVSWKGSRRDLDVEAELVLSDSEFDVFAGLATGERERYMEEFWNQHDPTPDTAFNEVKTEFDRRVAHADIYYAENRRGALTDRGKVYVRLGPPHEVQQEMVPKHLAGTGTEELVEKVEDPYAPSEHEPPLGDLSGSGAEINRNATQAAREHHRIVGRAGELVSYELWTYVGGGAPLIPVDRALGIDTGLRLLFVDTSGVGNFHLRKSSAKLSIRGLGASF